MKKYHLVTFQKCAIIYVCTQQLYVQGLVKSYVAQVRGHSPVPTGSSSVALGYRHFIYNYSVMLHSQLLLHNEFIVLTMNMKNKIRNLYNILLIYFQYYKKKTAGIQQ